MTKTEKSNPFSSPSALQPVTQYIQILQPKNNESFVRSILLKALSDPCVYVGFAELRSIPSVVTVLQDSPSGRAMLNTLDLFSYGTYRQYASMPEGKFITLTASQLTKLKALTVVTIVQQHCDEENSISLESMSNAVAGSSRRSRRRGDQSPGSPVRNSSCRIIPYSVLQSELDIVPEVKIGSSSNGDNQSEKKRNVRSLEDLLIHCIYSHLLPPGSKLDQRNMALVINLSSKSTSSAASNESNHVLCRDVNIETDLSDMISKLEVLYEKGTERMLVLNGCIRRLNLDAVNDEKKSRSIEKHICETKENIAQCDPGRNEDTMRMLIEGDALGAAAAGRSERKVKRSRGWLRVK